MRRRLGGTLSTFCVQLVVGTRPEAIKLAPLAHALAADGIAPHLILTGQHPGLAAADHGLGGLPCELLACHGIADPVEHAGLVAASLIPVLGRLQPDLVVVQGDTSSALGGAEAAAELGLPLAHVEAGLRSFDRAMPWPEEGNRIAIDQLADLLFAPTEGAADNLRREQLQGAIHVTGNTGIDALLATLATLPPPRPRRPASDVPINLLVTCHRRENWGTGLTAIALALVRLARDDIARIDVVLHPNPRIAEVMHLLFADQSGISLSLPTSHREMVQRMRDADLILSDSGGIQEEAPTLGTPLLVLRERTERPEAVAGGHALLVGTSTLRIETEVRRLAADRARLHHMAHRGSPFGDGKAAPRIAALIGQWLANHERTVSLRRQA